LAEYFGNKDLLLPIYKVVLAMGRITNDIPVSKIVRCGRIVPAHAETALMGIIMIIEGNRRVP
jgi:hypothetical protein